jgi:predicted transcriptional regulator
MEYLMESNNVIDGELHDPAPADEAAKNANSSKQGGAGFKEAVKTVENIGQTIGDALQSRGNVVMVRVNDDTLRRLDQLVDAEVTKSRSESAAYLINEGVKANDALFQKINEITDQIAQLRSQLRETIQSDQTKE